MTYPPAEPDLSQVCPHLGLGDDPDSHATYATEAHRCYKMPNPTRIAGGHQETYCLVANHRTCPVFTGEGISRVAAPAAAAAGMATAANVPPARPEVPADPAETVAGPAAGSPRPGQRTRAAGPTPGPRAKRPGAQDGQLRARPRPGGISMPAATIGLFALAIVLVAVAFLINQAVDDDGGGTISEPDAFGTQNANRTASAGSQTQTQPAGQTPGAGTQTTTTTQQAGQTPGATRTGTTTPGAGGGTYTVASGDFCGSIADDNNITLEQLLTANDMEESDCNNLQVGQVLKLP